MRPAPARTEFLHNVPVRCGGGGVSMGLLREGAHSDWTKVIMTGKGRSAQVWVGLGVSKLGNKC